MEAQQPPERPFRVGISGSYGGLNLGDEAILESIVNQLTQSAPVEITVFTRDAEDTRRRHPRVARVVPVRDIGRNDVLPEIERLDLFILGGGGILFDAEARIYLREALLAIERSIPVMTYAIGVGPLETAEAQRQVRDCLNAADLITVREAGAAKLLEEIGVKRKVFVTADPAFLLEPAALAPGTLEREALNPSRRLIGMSVREPGVAAPDIDESVYHSLLANAADFMVERFDADIVMVPMEPKMLDVRHCHAVVAQMLRPQHATVLKGSYTSSQMLSLVGQFAFVVGMRLHFLIFAALRGVPFVALPYAGKVAGFLSDMGLVMPPLHLVNAGRLIAHIDQNWDAREVSRAQVAKALPALKQRAAETHQLAQRLLSTRHFPVTTSPASGANAPRGMPS